MSKQISPVESATSYIEELKQFPNSFVHVPARETLDCDLQYLPDTATLLGMVGVGRNVQAPHSPVTIQAGMTPDLGMPALEPLRVSIGNQAIDALRAIDKPNELTEAAINYGVSEWYSPRMDANHPSRRLMGGFAIYDSFDNPKVHFFMDRSLYRDMKSGMADLEAYSREQGVHMYNRRALKAALITEKLPRIALVKFLLASNMPDELFQATVQKKTVETQPTAMLTAA